MKQIVFCIFLLLCFASCKTTKIIDEIPVVVPQTNTEYVYVNRTDTVVFNDSIYVHDSINTVVKGDTVVIEKFKTEYKYKYIKEESISKDTVHIVDSIPVVTTVTKTKVEEVNRLNWFQKTFMYLGIGGALLLTLYAFIKLKLKI